MISGSCLCGHVRFSLLTPPQKYYRCHCSLCRKQTGTGHNLATLVPAGQFQWHPENGAIGSWSKASGYRNDFCTACGSTVPNTLRNQPYVWVPVGLLDDDVALTCAADYCTADAMSWDCQRSPLASTGTVNSVEELLKVLGSDKV